jgi:hypothetical protein
MKVILINDFIKELGNILFEIGSYSRQTAVELHSEFGWNDNDSRMYFFNALGQISFLHGLTINFIDSEIRENKNQWREKQEFFVASGKHEFEGIVENFPGIVYQNFFLDFLIVLEHSFRIFGEKITPSIIDSSISTVKDQIIKQLNLDTEYKKLFDIIFKLRNTIHNGGLHSENKPSITYKGKTFDFREKKESQASLENIKFLFNEALIFKKDLFIHDKSKKIRDMEHPYKPLFNPIN